MFRRIGGFVVHIFRKIKLTAYNIFQTSYRGFFGKLQSTVHISVIGNTDGIYRIAFAMFYQTVDFARSVQ